MLRMGMGFHISIYTMPIYFRLATASCEGLLRPHERRAPAAAFNTSQLNSTKNLR